MSRGNRILVAALVEGKPEYIATLDKTLALKSVDPLLQELYTAAKKFMTNKNLQKIRLRFEDLVEALQEGYWIGAERSYNSLREAEGELGLVDLVVIKDEKETLYGPNILKV